MNEGPARGPVLQRFEGSVGELRALAYVRGIAGLAALLGSLAMLLGKLPVALFLVAALGIAMSLLWMRQARVLWRKAATRQPPALVIHRAGVMLEDGAHSTWLPFAEVLVFEVDPERVDVRVTMRSGEARRIDPQYQGVDIDALVRTLEDARRACPAPGENTRERA